MVTKVADAVTFRYALIVRHIVSRHRTAEAAAKAGARYLSRHRKRRHGASVRIVHTRKGKSIC
jgi:hypothetical protein